MPPSQKKPDTLKSDASFNVWLLFADVGMKIAAPVVISELLAIKLDKSLGTTPLFIVLALIGSFALSIALLVRDIKRINKLYDKKRDS